MLEAANLPECIRDGEDNIASAYEEVSEQLTVPSAAQQDMVAGSDSQHIDSGHLLLLRRHACQYHD